MDWKNRSLYENRKNRRADLLFHSICACPAVIFMLWFVINVSSIASEHMDYQIEYPIWMLALGVVLLLIQFFLRHVRLKMNGRCYIVPAIYILVGMITLLVGWATPCC